ncbi:MAG: serine hydrolase, partial [Gemmatimonadetes bacterium]
MTTRVVARRLALVLLCGPALPFAARGQAATAGDSIDRYIGAELDRYHIPGMSVAVLRGDSVLLARGYGYANVELRVPASDSTVYQSGSVG